MKILPLGYRPGLDGMRGIAIFAVMVAHANHFVLQGGTAGVDIFFCLSGFLITSLLLQEWDDRGTVNIKNFYVRRVLRLFPALFALVAVAVVYACIFLQPAARYELLTVAASSLLYVTNWGQAFGWLNSGGYGLGHTWSLSIEEQFYVFWPLTLLCLLRIRNRPWWIVAVIAAAIFGVTMERALLWHDGSGAQRIYRGLDTRADSLLTGAMAGMIGTWRLLDSHRKAVQVGLGLATGLSAAFLGFLILAIHWPLKARDAFLDHDGGLTLVAVAVGSILLWMRLYPGTLPDRLLSSPPLVWVGKISYGLYLWHWFIYVVIDDHLPPGGWKMIVGLKFSLSFLAAFLSYRYVEEPFLKLKARFTPREASRPLNYPVALADNGKDGLSGPPSIPSE